MSWGGPSWDLASQTPPVVVMSNGAILDIHNNSIEDLMRARIVMPIAFFGWILLLVTSACSGSGGSESPGPVPAVISSITVSPTTANLAAGSQQQFSASVQGTGNFNGTVNWNGTGGQITSTGLFTAPTAAGNYTVTATSAQDGSKSGSATVTVKVPATITSLVVEPSLVSLSIGGQQQFSASVTGTGDFSRAVNWSTTGGFIDVSGLYTAPITAGTYLVTAASVQDPNQHGTASIEVTVPASGNIVLFAGAISGEGNVDGKGVLARFQSPQGLAVDGAGNVYVADNQNCTIRKITPAGTVSTLAGFPGVGNSIDGQGNSASFLYPTGMAVDRSGNVYVADGENHTIRKITPSGEVSTFAGMPKVSGSADGQGSAAKFKNPSGLAVDSAGNIYVAEHGNHIIRKITPLGLVTTLAGLAGVSGSADGEGGIARFYYPHGLAVDGVGNVFVADPGNNTIRKITPLGVVSTFSGLAGSGVGSADGQGNVARYWGPMGVAIDTAGTLFVVDSGNNTLRKITPSGLVSTIAGKPRVSGPDNRMVVGFVDGQGEAARFNGPTGIAMDGMGNLYVADSGNNTIRKVTPSGLVSTLAGLGYDFGNADGQGNSAKFFGLFGIAVDSGGNSFVADRENNTIRKITPSGLVSTFAGLAGVWGSADGQGNAARFWAPYGIAVDGPGNVYVADFANHTVRKITPSGLVSTLAGLVGSPGSNDGLGSEARFKYPQDLTVDSAGNVYVVDWGNSTIRKISPTGYVSTIAGQVGVNGSADGQGSAASFCSPWGVAVDGIGNVYVTDTQNHTIRKITPTGFVSTFAGLPGMYSYPGVDGQGNVARFCWPRGIAFSKRSGNLYVADWFNSTIRMITPSGMVSTPIGVAPHAGTVLGILPALLAWPSCLAVSPSGQIFLTVKEAVLVATVGNGVLSTFSPSPEPGITGESLVDQMYPSVTKQPLSKPLWGPTSYVLPTKTVTTIPTK